MKKSKLFATVIIMALAFSLSTVSALAASVKYEAGYTTPIRHRFDTGLYFKGSGSWQSVTDDNDHSYRIDTVSGDRWESYQYTWVYSASGVALSSRASVESGQSESLTLSSNVNSYSSVKLRIKNPSYDSDPSLRLQTDGHMVVAYG